MPTIAFKALRRVVIKPTFYLTIDGDTIIVIKGDQLAQAQSTSQGTGLMGNTFH